MGSLMTDMIFFLRSARIDGPRRLGCQATDFDTREDEARSVTTSLGSGETRSRRRDGKSVAALRC
jgi:hypothetical protein